MCFDTGLKLAREQKFDSFNCWGSVLLSHKMPWDSKHIFPCLCKRVETCRFFWTREPFSFRWCSWFLLGFLSSNTQICCSTGDKSAERPSPELHQWRVPVQVPHQLGQRGLPVQEQVLPVVVRMSTSGLPATWLPPRTRDNRATANARVPGTGTVFRHFPGWDAGWG